MEVSTLFVAITALIVLAVTSVRFSVDSRNSWASMEREGTPWSIVEG